MVLAFEKLVQQFLGVGTPTGDLVYMQAVWAYARETADLSDGSEDGKYPQRTPGYKMFFLCHKVRGIFLTHYGLVRIAAIFLFLKGVWYGSPAAGGKHGSAEALALQSKCAKEVSDILLPKLDDMLRLHDPAAWPDFRSQLQWATGSGHLGRLILAQAKASHMVVYPHLTPHTQRCLGGPFIDVVSKEDEDCPWFTCTKRVINLPDEPAATTALEKAKADAQRISDELKELGMLGKGQKGDKCDDSPHIHVIKSVSVVFRPKMFYLYASSPVFMVLVPRTYGVFGYYFALFRLLSLPRHVPRDRVRNSAKCGE